MNGLERRKLKSRSHRVEEFLWDVEKHTFLMIYTDAIVFMRCRKTYVPNDICRFYCFYYKFFIQGSTNYISKTTENSNQDCKNSKLINHPKSS